MPYLDDDRSVQDSAPVELYEFVMYDTTYRRTSHNKDFSFLGFTWTAITLERSPVAGTTHNDPPDLEITIPMRDALIQDNAFDLPRSIFCTVRRVQQVSAASIILWEGNIGSITIEGDDARIRIPHLFEEAMSTPIPSTAIQAQCNHDLGGEICRVDMESPLYKLEAEIATVVGKVVNVTDIAGFEDDWFKAGDITDVLTGERRMIVSQVGTQLVLEAPLGVLAAGRDVILRAGCPHLPIPCRDKFDNIPNYGGHPFIRDRNPFTAGFRAVFTF